MGLSNDIVSQFVKITNDTTETKKESIVYGTIVNYDGTKYVKIDGSDLLTPITSTADSQDGERVTVMIKNHTATVTGNVSSPAARTADVKGMGSDYQKLSDKIDQFEIIVADKVDTDTLNAMSGRIDYLVSDNTVIRQSLTAAQSDVNALTTRVSSAETEISQNKEAIALRATKTEVAESLSGYYTKEQTDAKIKVESDKIASAVTRISNNEESISLLVKKVQDLQEQINVLRTS